MTQDLELRLSARAEDLTRLVRSPALSLFSAGTVSTKRANATYYDTAKLALARHGWTVQVCKRGKAYLQMVRDEKHDGLAAPAKVWRNTLLSPEADLHAVADRNVRAQLLEASKGEVLIPKFETEIRQSKCKIKTEHGEEISLTSEQGELRILANGSAIMPVHDIVLGSKDSAADSLYSLARHLACETPMVLDIENYAERGLRALNGAAPHAVKAGHLHLPHDINAEDAFRATLLHCLKHISRNALVVSEMRDPEGVHQLRVGLRRLRAALTAFGPAFRTAATKDLGKRAKALAQSLGCTRDLDVFANELLPPVERAMPERFGLLFIWQNVETRRKILWDDTVALLRSDAFNGFLLDLASCAENQWWRNEVKASGIAQFEQPALDLARKSLAKRYEKTHRQGRNLAKMDTAERHRLRITLKKMRYAAEFFSPLFQASAAKPFLSQLSKMQDIFGALNDAENAQEIVRDLAGGASKGGSPGEAVAFVKGWYKKRSESVWHRAKKRWAQFEAAEKFWERAKA